MKWWELVPWPYCLLRLSFKPAFSLSFFTFINKSFVFSSLSAIRVVIIYISEVVGVSPSKLDSSLWFSQPGISHDVLCCEKSRQCIKKQRHHFANKGPYSHSYNFPQSHVWMWELDHKDWVWLIAKGEGGSRGWDGWMASLTQWTWVWTNLGRWWRTGKPGVLQCMGLQRVRCDLDTGQQHLFI